MTMLKSSELIKMFERMRDENWAYVWGSAKEGTVDCSGAFVWAFEQYNQKIPHGSNSMGHKSVEQLLPIEDAKPGMAVFRCKPWGDSEDDKKNSYYNVWPGNLSHAGLVGRDGKTVLHASSKKTGFIESKLNHTWAYVGYLNDVDYSENNQNGSDFGMNEFPVYGLISITSGYVNLRAKPSVTSKVLAHMEKDELVEILSEIPDNDKWLYITYKGTEGYVYSKYVAQNAAVLDRFNTDQLAPVESQTVTIVDSEGNRFEPIGDFRVLFGPID